MIPVANPMTAVPLTVSIFNDEAEDPHEMDGQWTLHQFSRDKSHFTDPYELFTENRKIRNPGLRRKLDVGLAFLVSYYEHGQCVWSIKGTGPQCRFDSVGLAGILVWENKPGDMGAKSYEDRQKDAAAFLQTYTDWCNGNVYGYSIDDPEGEVNDGCGGYFGHDTEYMLKCIQDAAGERPVKFDGDASDIGDGYKGRTWDGDED